MTDHDRRSALSQSEGTGSRTRTAFIAAVLVAVLGSGGVAWFAYNKGFYSASDELAPIVRAETGETKRRPEQPGGLEVPHQDKLVFERLAPGQTGPRVERLLPPPEEPVAKPAPTPVAVVESPPVVVPEPAPAPLPPAPVAATIVEALVDREPEPTGQIAAPVPQVVAETSDPEPPKTESLLAENPAAPTPPAPTVAEAPPAAPAAEVAAVPADPKPEIRPAAASPAVVWRIQLASLSSSQGAEAEWQRIKGRHPELLGSLGLNIQKADLSRGTFYRIQAGAFADQTAARQLCASLKERQQDCLVVQQ